MVANPPPQSGGNQDNLSVQDLVNEEALKNQRIIPTSAGIASDSEVNNVSEDIVRKRNLPTNNTNINSAKIEMAMLAQQGATSPKFSEKRAAEIGKLRITVAEIREACRKNNTTLRKIARNANQKQIALDLAVKFDIPGNLAKGYLLEYPHAERTDLYWASDFQTFSDDPNMPHQVKEYLLKNYQTRFVKKNN